MKKILFLLLPAFFASIALQAQSNDMPADPSRVYTKAEHEPVYKGGDSAWMKFLMKNLNYPQGAIDREKQGTVMVGFIVDTTGHISGIEAITNPDKYLVRESLRIIQLSDGNWEPATQGGQKVRCYAKRPIIFRLERGN